MEICWNGYFLAFLDGSYIEESFSKNTARKNHFKTLFLLIVQAAFLSVEVCICDSFVKFRKDGYILAVLAGYLLRGLFRGGYLWQLYYKELSMGVKWPFLMPTKWEHLFQGCFSLEYFRLGELPVFNGHSTNQRYFNSALASTIFSKNFSTNFFFGLYFSRFQCLPIRGMIFRKP